MRKIICLTVATAAVIFICAGLRAAGNEYILYGDVYNADGSPGTNLTENSFCGLRAFRTGINGQIGTQVNNIEAPACSNKILDATGGDPAYFLSDVGSTAWPVQPVPGDVIITVTEAYGGQFAGCTWSGTGYAGAVKSVVSGTNTYNARSDMPPTTLNTIPVPQASAAGADSIALTWTGCPNDNDNLISGYTVYRSSEPGGAGGFGIIGTAAQAKGAAVTYNDAGLAAQNTYYYRIAINFAWGGGNGAPDYYTTEAMSGVSAGMFIGPSPTMTESPATQVPSPTVTATGTMTCTATGTFTTTCTPTYTPTITPSITETMTPTYTMTVTPTPTYTCTTTPTFTPTGSPTCTLTATAVPASALAANLAGEKAVIFNDPIKDGTLSIGIYAEKNGTAFIYAYDINGGLVRKISLAVSAGANLYSGEFKKAPGVYILRSVIKYDDKTHELPLRKFAVIK